MIGPRANLTTPQAVMNDHGGELTFWLAWLSNELKPEVRDWFREQSGRDPALQKQLENIDQAGAREQLHFALEATNYLTPRDPTAGTLTGLEPLTDLVRGNDEQPRAERAAPPGAASAEWRLAHVAQRRRQARDSAPHELHRRVSRSLFRLLSEVEIPLPAADEAREASILLHHLVGRPAVERYRQIDRWLNEARLRAGTVAGLALDQVLHWLTPELFQADGQGFHYQLSFRLYLRSRFRQHCKQHGWQPVGPRYCDLDSAFTHLQRDRIGQIVREALEESADEALEQARVSPREVFRWLAVAP